MNNFKIFIEGIADQTFIRQYIAYIKSMPINKISDKDIIICGGKSNLWSEKEVENKLKESIENNITPLIIFDADKSVPSTRREISQHLYGIDIYPRQYELFLFPNDHDPGDLESLLEKIIPQKNIPLLVCWEKYEESLQSYATPFIRPAPLLPLTAPARKTKIYAYLEALLGESKKEKERIKESKREYHNEEHWDLNSNHLSCLKNFLLIHI